MTEISAPEPSLSSRTIASHEQLLPPGAILLHIGPHKTGTTTVQYAFHETRAALRAQGVHYAGRWRHSVEAAQAVRGLAPKRSHRHGLRQWRRLVDESRNAPDARIVISSEWFSEATPAAIPRIIDDLGAERVHVVLTIRPLARILPSQWQQYVQDWITAPYEEWLDGVLNHPDDSPTPTFWIRHRHDELLARWATVVGSDRITVVIADDRDRRFVLRAFEGMLGLRPDTLDLREDRSNRSFTWPEVEVVRQINKSLGDAGVDRAIRQDLVLFGVSPALREREPTDDEPRIVTPRWALERAGQIGQEMAASIGASGARVVGDLSLLGSVPASAPIRGGRPVETWPEIAGEAVRGVVIRSGLTPAVDASSVRAIPLRHVSTTRLMRTLARRLRRAAAQRLLGT